MASESVFSTDYRMRNHDDAEPKQEDSRASLSPNTGSTSPSYFTRSRTASISEMMVLQLDQKRSAQKPLTETVPEHTELTAPLPPALIGTRRGEAKATMDDVSDGGDLGIPTDLSKLAARLSQVEQTQAEVLQKLDALPELISNTIRAT